MNITNLMNREPIVNTPLQNANASLGEYLHRMAKYWMSERDDLLRCPQHDALWSLKHDNKLICQLCEGEKQ